METEGGHSSVPPDHTGVGILSKIISAIEGHPYEPELTPVNRESPLQLPLPPVLNLHSVLHNSSMRSRIRPRHESRSPLQNQRRTHQQTRRQSRSRRLIRNRYLPAIFNANFTSNRSHLRRREDQCSTRESLRCNQPPHRSRKQSQRHPSQPRIPHHL